MSDLHWLRHFRIVAFNMQVTWPRAHVTMSCNTCFAEFKGKDFHDESLLDMYEAARDHHRSHGYDV